MRARFPGLAAPIAVFALAIVALVLSIIAAPNDGSCDNIAGTCLRQRQDLLITAIEVTCLLVALIAAGCLALWAQGHARSRTAWSILTICALFATAVVVVQPVDHLNNRYRGWFSDR
jgi:hypothetical protein